MKYFIANWKMNMTKENVLVWLKSWEEKMDQTGISENDIKNEKVIVAPSAVHLQLTKEILQKNMVAAQNVSEFEKGPYTGSTGVHQIKEYCDYCIIGHSDLKESKEIVIKKTNLCIQNNITPIICFINPKDAKDYYANGVILVWEDPKNISKNQIYTAKNPEDIKVQISKIKKTLPEGAEILYGGSVNNQNIKDLKKISELNGVLVGNASLDPDHFYELVTLR